MYSNQIIPRDRNRVDIIADILDVAQRDTPKTQTVSKANLSYNPLEKYLSFLVQIELLQKSVDVQTGKTLYHVTDKGMSFLKDYCDLPTPAKMCNPVTR